MTGEADSGKSQLDDSSVEVYNAQDEDAKVILTEEGELRLDVEGHKPLLLKYKEQGILIWDRVRKTDFLLPWRVVDFLRDWADDNIR